MESVNLRLIDFSKNEIYMHGTESKIKINVRELISDDIVFYWGMNQFS